MTEAQIQAGKNFRYEYWSLRYFYDAGYLAAKHDWIERFILPGIRGNNGKLEILNLFQPH